MEATNNIEIPKFDGMPRSELERRIEWLVATLLSERVQNKQLLEQLTSVQERCTAQEEELRLHRRQQALTGEEWCFLLDAAHANTIGKQKYPGPYSLEHMICVLAEESGAAARAHCHKEGNARILEEITQVAGVCLRIATECLGADT
jgi:hypothetical protein